MQENSGFALGKGEKWMGRISVQEEKWKDYDILEKELKDYPDVFSDIIDVFVYQGEKVLNPENY